VSHSKSWSVLVSHKVRYRILAGVSDSTLFLEFLNRRDARDLAVDLMAIADCGRMYGPGDAESDMFVDQEIGG
jgi:hypothetical protein